MQLTESARPDKYGFNIWTKNKPKSYIDDYAQYALNRQQPIEAIVDDVLPAAVFGRTPRETAEMSKLYEDYMRTVGFSEISFVSEMLPEREYDLERLYRMSGKVALSTFLGLLPEYKRLNQEELGLNEIIDPCWQLEVLAAGIAQNGITKYLTGRRSLAIFRLAKDTISGLDFEVIDEAR
jgi:hypothetical protein